MWNKLKKLRCYAIRNSHKFHRTHNFLHLMYFSFVAVGGPYDWAAAALLIVGVASWILHLEG